MNIFPDENSSSFGNCSYLLATQEKSVTFDAQRYQEILDMPELSDEQRSEIVATLWSMIMTFIDIGYQVQTTETIDVPAPSKSKEIRREE